MTQQENDIEALHAKVSLSEDLAGLYEDERFIRVFKDKFIDAWAITNTMNMANYDTQTRARVHEKMVARGHFMDFCNTVIDDGLSAADELASLSNKS